MVEKKIKLNFSGNENIGYVNIDLENNGKCTKTKGVNCEDCFRDEDDNHVMYVTIPYKKPFKSMNHESCVSPMEQELGAYEALKKSYLKGDYYDCHVLIANYFGHIDYGKEFGYYKTHDEICLILYSNLLSTLSKQNKDKEEDGFLSFVDMMINKIHYSFR